MTQKIQYDSIAIRRKKGTFCAAIEFGIQPLLFTDAAGKALYCPYPLTISIPAMMIGHLTLFGIAEIVLTTAILAFVEKISPETLEEKPALQEYP